MDRSNVMQLITKTYTEDAIAQRIPAETTRNVFCSIASVSASEWFEAGRAGMQAALKVTMFAPDYQANRSPWWTVCGTACTVLTAQK